MLGAIGLVTTAFLSNTADPTDSGPDLAGLVAPEVQREGLPEGWTMTRSGPLSPSDRDLLVRVRLAGLWEAPVGQQAQDHASSQRVKDVGHHLATDHLELDEKVRTVAAQLGVELPSQPNQEQRGWMAELSGKRGADFDRAFANRLRAAHGKVFAVVSSVRASTRNEVIRAFAQTAVNVVQKHMTLLESTGLVDYEALPTAPVAAGPTVAAAALSTRSSSLNPAVVWMVLGVALVAGVLTTTRVVRPR